MISRLFANMASLLVATALVLWLNFQQLSAEKCISGPFHRNTSSPGGSDFVECLDYRSNACCTGALTKAIKYHPETLYNFTWHHCNAVSSKCVRYLKNEECFYQCEPTLIRYQRPGRPDAVKNVPICSNYCDKWFDACKDDSTCVVNWESDFVIKGKQYACPRNSKCRKFKEVYKNAAGLCNKMWGVSFSYHNDSGSCYTMGPHATKQPSSAIAIQPMSFSIIAAIFITALLGYVSR